MFVSNWKFIFPNYKQDKILTFGKQIFLREMLSMILYDNISLKNIC